MPIYSVQRVGDVGVIADEANRSAPANAWTSATNTRFENGLAISIMGEAQHGGTPIVEPYHVCPALVAGLPYWIYAGAQKIYVVDHAGNHNNITRQTADVDVNYNSVDFNEWTSTHLSGLPILNNEADDPQVWDLNTTNNFAALSNWPASTKARSIRAFKNVLIALGVTKTDTYYPSLVKWSHPADPGSVPSSWDQTDATKDAGEYDVGDSWDGIVDGLQLRDSFLIYKDASIWRMDFIGGPYIYRFTKVLGSDGLMALNCVTEMNGAHIAVTTSDVIIHDGVTFRSLLNNRVRKYWAQRVNATNYKQTFIVKNQIHNEVIVVYTTDTDNTIQEGMRINLGSGAVSFEPMKGIRHGATGLVAAVASPWYSTWTVDDLTVKAQRLVLADVTNKKMWRMDGASTYLESTRAYAQLQRTGLDFGLPNRRKLVTAVRPKFTGITNDTITVSVASSDSPNGTYSSAESQTYTIGSTFDCAFTVEGRFFSVTFAAVSNTNQWALESYDVIYEDVGEW